MMPRFTCCIKTAESATARQQMKDDFGGTVYTSTSRPFTYRNLPLSLTFISGHSHAEKARGEAILRADELAAPCPGSRAKRLADDFCIAAISRKRGFPQPERRA